MVIPPTCAARNCEEETNPVRRSGRQPKFCSARCRSREHITRKREEQKAARLKCPTCGCTCNQMLLLELQQVEALR